MSAENAWRIAREEAAIWHKRQAAEADARASCAYLAESILRNNQIAHTHEASANVMRSLPMPSAFRAEVEAEELRAALVQIAALVLAHIAGEIARKAISRLEAKGESHE